MSLIPSLLYIIGSSRCYPRHVTTNDVDRISDFRSTQHNITAFYWPTLGMWYQCRMVKGTMDTMHRYTPRTVESVGADSISPWPCMTCLGADIHCCQRSPTDTWKTPAWLLPTFSYYSLSNLISIYGGKTWGRLGIMSLSSTQNCTDSVLELYRLCQRNIDSYKLSQPCSRIQARSQAIYGYIVTSLYVWRQLEAIWSWMFY